MEKEREKYVVLLNRCCEEFLKMYSNEKGLGIYREGNDKLEVGEYSFGYSGSGRLKVVMMVWGKW